MTEKTGTMVIRFVDGTEERLEYAGLPQDDVNMATRIEEALKAEHLLVEFEGKLVVYPFNCVKAIEVSPAPEKLPRGVLKNAHLV
jgi:hypothetical protein